MSTKLKGPELVAAARIAVDQVLDWVRDPDAQPRPSRSLVADAVRLSAAVMAEVAPGQSVELRIPPFAAVQCVDGPKHRRGTPPNVVQCSPQTWLRLAVGEEHLEASDADASGARAQSLAEHLPLLRFR